MTSGAPPTHPPPSSYEDPRLLPHAPSTGITTATPSAGVELHQVAGGARVLVVDDEPAFRRSIARFLMARGFAVDTAEDGPAALALLTTRSIDVVLVDLAMPAMNGMDVLGRVRHHFPDVEVVMMVPFGDADASSAAIRAGAYGVVSKPISSHDDAALVLERAAERRRLVDRARTLERRLDQHERFGELVGTSAAMQEVYRIALGVAPTTSSALLIGEPGTGKELVARAIHRHSSRADRPLHIVDCGALPEVIADAELFGRTRSDGPAQPGILALAHDGTVLLESVGALSLVVQHKLVRALMQGEIEREGTTVPVRVDARVLAAAGPDLRERMAKGHFREDLYYRLGAVQVHVPPLRKRRDDIALLAYHFLQRFARRAGRDVRRIGVEALRLLRDHPWPGNVRELEGAIEHAVVMARGDAIMPADLPFSQGQADPGDHGPLSFGKGLSELAYPEAKDRALDTFDRAYVEMLMERAAGNVSEAARQAGMDRSNFRRLLKKVLERGKAR